MFVANYMTPDPTTVSVVAKVAEARKLMTEDNVGHLPVLGNARTLAGLLTKRQALGAPSGSRCGEIMTWNPITVRGDTPVVAALRLTREQSVSALPVVSEDRKLDGFITRGDLLSATYRSLGLDQVGNCIELALKDPVHDAVTALDTLRKNGIEPIIAVLDHAGDEGGQPALHVHVAPHAARPAERALSRAGFVLLVAEGQERAR